MRSPPLRRKRRIRSGICRIGIIVSLLVCTALYIVVAGVLTGMVPWQEVNIEAPIARAFSRSRIDHSLAHHYTAARSPD